MSIDEFASILEEFISEYDSVLVPGLGVFYAKLETAEISDRGFVINPPYRSLSFVGGNADGPSEMNLAVLYASKYKKDRDGVLDQMAAVVREIHNSLASEGECVLQSIGTLRLLGGEWPVLVPALDLDIYPECFGLESVSLKNREGLGRAGAAPERAYIVKKESPEEVSEVAPEVTADVVPEVAEKPEKPSGKKEKKKRRFHPWRWVWITLLVLCVLAVAGFFILAEFAPDVLDTLLYTPEQLEIIQFSKQ